MYTVHEWSVSCNICRACCCSSLVHLTMRGGGGVECVAELLAFNVLVDGHFVSDLQALGGELGKQDQPADDEKELKATRERVVEVVAGKRHHAVQVLVQRTASNRAISGEKTVRRGRRKRIEVDVFVLGVQGFNLCSARSVAQASNSRGNGVQRRAGEVQGLLCRIDKLVKREV